MTIFLMVLKKLIKEQLSPLSGKLAYQSTAYGYKHELSKDQKQVIDDLSDLVVLFNGSDNDKIDSKEIIAIIEAARSKIQVTRESHGESRDKGNTITVLNDIILHTNDFYKKLDGFNFKLLNKIYSETPENIVYYHAGYYFGEDIFNPKKNIDVEIRTKKEKRLETRLKALSELIKPTHTLKEQRERTLQVLEDLARDNQEVIKKDASDIAIPGLTFWGFQLTAPNDWFSASEGRFGQEFNAALRRINSLIPEEFAPQATK